MWFGALFGQERVMVDDVWVEVSVVNENISVYLYDGCVREKQRKKCFFFIKNQWSMSVVYDTIDDIWQVIDGTHFLSIVLALCWQCGELIGNSNYAFVVVTRNCDAVWVANCRIRYLWYTYLYPVKWIMRKWSLKCIILYKHTIFNIKMAIFPLHNGKIAIKTHSSQK